MYANKGPKVASSLRVSIIFMLHLIIMPLMISNSIECNESLEEASNPSSKTPSKNKDGSQSLVEKQTEATSMSAPNRTTSVTDLRLTSDFRAVKLRWTYRTNSNNKNDYRTMNYEEEPASFDIRYCELTSWNIEIKCRHKEMLSVDDARGNQLKSDPHNDSSVIKQSNTKLDRLNVLSNNSGSIEYEAQIFDLRALTNYTFDVKVLRFRDELIQGPTSRDSAIVSRDNRATSGRRLIFEAESNQHNELVKKIETKAFRAEATKCLANISEVLITTGKYFGGRISVEDSTDKRCHLIGNKSSEQTSYVFKINHEICRSKILDGNRIETMILVHENKDILTHNTARFLVLCNFLQKSFTLRASVSLPKVNGVMSAPNSRPAVITPLSIKPRGNREQTALLGSIPVRFLAKQTNTTSDELGFVRSSNTNPPEEVETNIISEEDNKLKLENISGSRQAKGLDLPKKTISFQSRSSEHPARLSQLRPQPVEIKSKALFVDKQPASVVSGLIKADQYLQPTLGRDLVHESGIEKKRARLTIESISQKDQREDAIEVPQRPTSDVADYSQDSPIILTNNHRIADDFQAPDEHNDSSSSFSIKYSGAKVDEFSVGHGTESRQGTNIETKNSNKKAERRTGRMQQIDETPKILDASSWSVNRMGEMVGPYNNVDLMADTSNENISQTVAFNQTAIDSSRYPSLTQNLTSYLLKWSLRTLTTIAKKSLESLANRSDSNNSNDYPDDSLDLTTRPMNQIMVKTTEKPIPNQKALANPSSVAPLITERIRKEDGFYIDSLQRSSSPISRDELITTTMTPSKAASKSSPRSSSNLKSLDLDRSDGRQVGNKSNIGHLGGKVSALDHSAAHLDDGASFRIKDKGTSRLPAWILFGTLTVVVIIVSLMVAFCLVSYPSGKKRLDPSEMGRPIYPTIYPNSIHTHNLPNQLIYNATSDHNQVKEVLQGSRSYEKYDNRLYDRGGGRGRGLSRSSGSSNGGSLLDGDSNSNLIQNNKQHRPCTFESTTRSTSASLPDENNCNNNELLFTEHVLINTSSNSNESFA